MITGAGLFNKISQLISIIFLGDDQGEEEEMHKNWLCATFQKNFEI